MEKKLTHNRYQNRTQSTRRMSWTASNNSSTWILFVTESPFDVNQPLESHLRDHTVAQLMTYFESVIRVTLKIPEMNYGIGKRNNDYTISSS